MVKKVCLFYKKTGELAPPRHYEIQSGAKVQIFSEPQNFVAT
jgi:hypothetical protein